MPRTKINPFARVTQAEIRLARAWRAITKDLYAGMTGPRKGASQ